ncbi:hypothetical protein [Mycobacterium sp.]|jgi:hypothetical protein|nr:hypothetical protein [Mycobacterium sp.]MDT5051994.1 hypothetical protein [Mycobacterium sp.]
MSMTISQLRATTDEEILRTTSMRQIPVPTKITTSMSFADAIPHAMRAGP